MGNESILVSVFPLAFTVVDHFTTLPLPTMGLFYLSMAYRLYDSCSSEKQLYVVHGANHAESYRKDPEGYENVIAQFVEEHSEALKKEY